MKARSVFHAAAAVFLFMAAYSLGAIRAQADFDPSSGSHIIAFSQEGSFMAALRLDGTLWWKTSLNGSWNLQVGSLPIPISEIAFFHGNTLVSKGGFVWVRDEASPWIRSPDALPPPAVRVETRTWSAVKKQHRE